MNNTPFSVIIIFYFNFPHLLNRAPPTYLSLPTTRGAAPTWDQPSARSPMVTTNTPELPSSHTSIGERIIRSRLLVQPWWHLPGRCATTGDRLPEPKTLIEETRNSFHLPPGPLSSFGLTGEFMTPLQLSQRSKLLSS